MSTNLEAASTAASSEATMASVAPSRSQDWVTWRPEDDSLLPLEAKVRSAIAAYRKVFGVEAGIFFPATSEDEAVNNASAEIHRSCDALKHAQNGLVNKYGSLIQQMEMHELLQEATAAFIKATEILRVEDDTMLARRCDELSLTLASTMSNALEIAALDEDTLSMLRRLAAAARAASLIVDEYRNAGIKDPETRYPVEFLSYLLDEECEPHGKAAWKAATSSTSPEDDLTRLQKETGWIKPEPSAIEKFANWINEVL